MPVLASYCTLSLTIQINTSSMVHLVEPLGEMTLEMTHNFVSSYSWHTGKFAPIGEAWTQGQPFINSLQLISLYNKTSWFSDFHDCSGVYFAVETGASEQMIRSEQRQLHKQQLRLFPSLPVRPKRKKLSTVEKLMPPSGGTAIVTDMPARSC